MQPLRNVIAALRREIEAALEPGANGASGTRLETGRVVLSLEISVRKPSEQDHSREPAIGVLETPDSGPDQEGETRRAHTLTIEFTAPKSSTPASPVQHLNGGTLASVPLEGAEAEAVIRSLSFLFGPPGFDSSARATVFREACEALPEEQARAVISSLKDPSHPDLDEPAKPARHLIMSVLKSGPAQSAGRGAEILSELLARHSLPALLQLIAREWKSQEYWLND